MIIHVTYEFNFMSGAESHLSHGAGIEGSKETFTLDLHQKVEIVRAECLTPCGRIVRCIDDRELLPFSDDTSLHEKIIREEQFNGPQFLGGSLGTLALVAEALARKSDHSKSLEFDAVYEETLRLHHLAGLKMGVHMDNDHGHKDEDAVLGHVRNCFECELGGPSLLTGCGAAKLKSHPENPFAFSPRVHELFVKYPNIVDEIVRREEGNLIILHGHHADIGTRAMAVENLTPGTTIDTKKAVRMGVQTYGHDTWALAALLEPMGEKTKNYLLQLNAKWLRIATGVLAGMDPVPLHHDNFGDRPGWSPAAL